MWGLCLPRWILNSGTSLAWHLRNSFTAEWRGSASSTATFPLPVPYPGCFQQSGPRLSKRRLEVLAQRKALHVAIIILNKMYLGPWPLCHPLAVEPDLQVEAVLCCVWTCPRAFAHCSLDRPVLNWARVYISLKVFWRWRLQFFMKIQLYFLQINTFS